MDGESRPIGDSSRKEASEQLTQLKFSFNHSARPQPQLLRQQQLLVYEGILFIDQCMHRIIYSELLDLGFR
jgi:hypothetical protein